MYPLVDSPNVYNIQVFARLKLGSRNSILVSHIVHRDSGLLLRYKSRRLAQKLKSWNGAMFH